ncbi:hypothetical protein L2E82_47329 [Cichorium intybus]|uniref:Uncharacterized protein n=1 Tax=Cichorium intybus TaxID=13427 RepID=A0ACB8YVH5_CICIN|nr:hypothetical protein L2E82_47329 [Cichorium intybus]
MDSVTDLPPMTALLADHVAEPPPALHTNHPHPPYPKYFSQSRSISPISRWEPHTRPHRLSLISQVDLIPNPVASHARSHRRSPDLTESPICLPIQFAVTWCLISGRMLVSGWFLVFGRGFC